MVERISKYLSECGVMSRRAADAEIKAGHVRINGRTAVTGEKTDTENDVIEYKGKVLEPEREKVYIMLNKPSGYITTSSDELGRKSVTELLSDVPGRVYPVGRLDCMSEGLLLFTNDGDAANRMMHPRYEKNKRYVVTVKGEVPDETLAVLGEPITIDGYRTKPARVAKISVGESRTKLAFTLTEGRNRQIRRMCEDKGLFVTSLVRVGYGELELGSLPVGRWRYLTKKEIGYIRGRSDGMK